MKTTRIVLLALLVAAPAYAGPVDAATFFSNAPVLSEGRLLALAVLVGLAGVRLVNRLQNRQQ